MQHLAYAKLSAFSLGSFELDAVSGGSHRYAEAVDEVSLSSEASELMEKPARPVRAESPEGDSSETQPA